MASSPLRTAVRMPGRPKNSLGPLVLFHGCDKDVSEAVLSGQATLQPSENDYDWLGNGIYFWVGRPRFHRMRSTMCSSRYTLMHMVERKARVQNSTAWLKIEPVDLRPYPAAPFH